MGVFFYFNNQGQPISTAPHITAPHATEGLLAQNTYLGPVKPVPGNPELVQVEVIVRDSPVLGGVQVQSVEFDGKSVPLKPRDVFGNRGKASFQVSSGHYTLRWVVRRDKILWPRTMSYEETVTIDPRDLWVQISIEGEASSIR
jgi:hypothetical protein